jgi:hypothetical protein
MNEAWQWRKVKCKTDRDDALKLARMAALGTPANLTPEDVVRGRRLGTMRVKALTREAYADLAPTIHQWRAGGGEFTRYCSDPQCPGSHMPWWRPRP